MNTLYNCFLATLYIEFRSRSAIPSLAYSVRLRLHARSFALLLRIILRVFFIFRYFQGTFGCQFLSTRINVSVEFQSFYVVCRTAYGLDVRFCDYP